MGPEPENLLERDRIEDVLAEDGPPPPVVVVQYGNKLRPWLLTIGAIVVLALGSAYAYHRREVARLRTQFQLADRDLHRAMEQARIEENERRLKALPPAPLVGPAEMSAILVSAGAGVSALPRASGPPPAAPPASGDSPAEEAKAPTPAAEVGRPGSGQPASLRPRVLTQLTGDLDPAGTPGPQPAVPNGTTKATGPAGIGQPDGSPPPTTAASDAAAPSPFDELDGVGGPDRALAPTDAAAAPASAAMVADSKPGAQTPDAMAPPDVRPAEPPLPSREETERQIRAEAAAIKQGNDQRLEQQQEDLHVLHDDERKQFTDELRMILKVQGPAAGPEIERLSNRAGRTEDPRLLMRARMVIGESRISQHAKVRKLREFGVPEAVILDYLCRTLDKNLGARNGPRTRNEVWTRAGKILLRYYDLDAHRPSDPPAVAGHPADPPAAPVGMPAAGGARARATTWLASAGHGLPGIGPGRQAPRHKHRPGPARRATPAWLRTADALHPRSRKG